jgi:simple sugar transport system permease protein
MSTPRFDWRVEILPPLCALLIAMALGSLLIVAYGAEPAAIYGMLLAGTWGDLAGLGQVLFKATPLIFTGLAVAVGLRAGLFNIGAEGQAIAGAFACALAGLALPEATPGMVAIPLCLFAAFAGGAAVGAVPGWLKSRFGAHEVINTIMLNFIVAALAGYVVTHHLHVPESVHTPPIPEAAQLPRLGEWVDAWSGSAANVSLLLALAVAIALRWFLFRTGAGFALRVAGMSPGAAAASGVSLRRVTVLTMALSGGLAGLVGVNFVMGYKHYFEQGFTAGVGYLGIAVALLGRNHPLGVVLAALLFGTLSQGGLVINKVIPKEIVDVLQAVIILAIAGSSAEVRRLVSASRASLEGR